MESFIVCISIFGVTTCTPVYQDESNPTHFYAPEGWSITGKTNDIAGTIKNFHVQMKPNDESKK